MPEGKQRKERKKSRLEVVGVERYSIAAECEHTEESREIHFSSEHNWVLISRGRRCTQQRKLNLKGFLRQNMRLNRMLQ